MNLLKLQATLPKIEALDKDLNPTTIAVQSFIIDGVLRVSAEYGGAADYYGEYRGGYPYIAPELEEWAESKGGFWEWQDPGSIGFYK